MATPLLDRVGLGNSRAVANAEREVQRRADEDRIVAELVAALARHVPAPVTDLVPDGGGTARCTPSPWAAPGPFPPAPSAEGEVTAAAS